MSKIFVGTVTPDAKDIDIFTDVSENSINPSNKTVQDFLNELSPKDSISKYSYLTNGEIDFIEFYSGQIATQNRYAKVKLNYAQENPVSEVWTFYDKSDGTTVLKTVTISYSFSGFDLTQNSMLVS